MQSGLREAIDQELRRLMLEKIAEARIELKRPKLGARVITMLTKQPAVDVISNCIRRAYRVGGTTTTMYEEIAIDPQFVGYIPAAVRNDALARIEELTND